MLGEGRLHLRPLGELAKYGLFQRGDGDRQIRVLFAADVQVAGLEGVAGLLRAAPVGCDLLAGAGQVAVAVAVDVERAAVPNDPYPVARLGAEDEQGVARRPRRVGRLLRDAPLDLRQVSGRGCPDESEERDAPGVTRHAVS